MKSAVPAPPIVSVSESSACRQDTAVAGPDDSGNLRAQRLRSTIRWGQDVLFESSHIVFTGCRARWLRGGSTTDLAHQRGPGALRPGGQSANSSGAEGINLTGSWTWEETVESAIPPFIVEMIGQGIVPEGEITYLTCKGGGEMQFVHNGRHLPKARQRKAAHA